LEPKMIENSILRRILLVLIALVHAGVAIRTLLDPEQSAAELGYTLLAPNGYSEMFAIYIGIWLAIAFLCMLASVRIELSLLGDLAAVFVLAQSVGRLLALVKYGLPQGPLLVFAVLEAVGGLALCAVRPKA